MPRDESTQKALDKLLEDHRLFAETPLYREAMRDALIPTQKPGIFRLNANPAPAESVVDVYGQGYVVQAPSRRSPWSVPGTARCPRDPSRSGKSTGHKLPISDCRFAICN
jgi:hypothetical protein